MKNITRRSHSLRDTRLLLRKFRWLFEVSVVLMRRNNTSDYHPCAHVQLKNGAALAILDSPAEIAQLARENL
jgi:hypothetical protein